MSIIVSPFPPRDRHAPAADARWWRLPLRPNGDGNLIVMRTDADAPSLSSATWVSWEFFDGHDTILDAGLDAPNVDQVRINNRSRSDGLGLLTAWWIDLDILCVQAPTPAPGWVALTPPGCHTHPGDGDGDDDRVCTPSRFRYRMGGLV